MSRALTKKNERNFLKAYVKKFKEEGKETNNIQEMYAVLINTIRAFNLPLFNKDNSNTTVGYKASILDRWEEFYNNVISVHYINRFEENELYFTESLILSLVV